MVVAGVNRPILAEIVPKDMRAITFSVEYALEGIAGAIFGAPLVGVSYLPSLTVLSYLALTLSYSFCSLLFVQLLFILV